MFGISKGEIEERLANEATNRMVKDHEVEVKKFGTVTYDEATGKYSFYPAPQLDQRMRRKGQ